jgi:3-oxoacyl-[acyl-carrier protein] reductase
MIDFKGKRILLLGASKGLGLALWRLFADEGALVSSVGRVAPKTGHAPAGTFFSADLTTPEGLNVVLNELNVQSYDCVVYIAGIWEARGFEAAQNSEIEAIVKTNLIAPMHIGQQLLRLSRKAVAQTNYILIGSTCGLENEGSSSAGYVSTKFGLRGLSYALREAARGRNLYVSCISPGSLQAADDVAPSAVGKRRIPPSDIFMTIRYLCSLSPCSIAKEVLLPAFDDTDV